MEQPVNLVMIRHIVAEVEKVIVINDGSDSSVTAAQASLPSPPVTPVKADFSVESRNPIPRNAPLPIPTLEQFIVTLVEGSNVQASTLLCTLVYFSKLRNKLPRMAKGGTCFSCLLFSIVYTFSSRDAVHAPPRLPRHAHRRRQVPQ